ncbi:MAG TPA: hypothetical protein VNO33_00575, partial [Kofleriaceae bacterium]|nr:hypothetical protein [Kofleriaceae bacterium]
MRDLELWRRLTAGDAAPADLLALASWPLDRRAPYLAAIEPLARHPDAEMRAAALRALAGVRGVAGVRAIVDGLEHGDDAVRTAALDALRATARDASSRFAHALFHPRPEIRRAALAGELPRAAADLGVYLRADPHCADLAARCPWPPAPLPLAFDLHALRHLSSAELAELMVATPTADLRAFLETQRGRAPQVVEVYLDEAVRSPQPLPAPGRDILDHVVVALDVAGNARAFVHFVEAVTTRRRRLARRAAASLLSRLATGGASSALVGVCVALEPRVLRCAGFDRALAAAAADGLVRFRWPVRPTPAQVDRLVALPLVRGGEEGVDLALGAALAGLWPGNRLARLVAALGQESIIAALLAGDRGWDEVCRLPREKPALELVWLQRIEQASPLRYVALAARALAWFTAERLDSFVEQMPRQHRGPAFLELVGLVARGELGPGHAQLAGVCRALAARLDRTGLAAILTRLLGEGGDGVVGVAHGLALELAGAVSDKILVSAARLVDDQTAAALVDAIDSSEGLAWERELALAGALGDRAEPRVREWTARLVRAGQARPAAPLPIVRARRPLNQAERERIATCPEGELDGALEPALTGPVTGLTVALERRDATPSVAACVALLGCVDPLDDVVRELDRFAAATPDFDGQLDAAAAARWPDAGELPLLAHARLHRWEAHQEALLRWMDESGGALAALAIANALPGRVAARSLWRAIGEALALLCYRDRARFVREASAQLAELAADHIDRDIGPDAARILVLLVEAGSVPLSAVRDRILDRAADSVAAAREHLARLIRLEGLPEPPPMPATPPTERELIATIRQSRDPDELIAWCEDARRPVVEAAVLRLLMLGAPGQDRLAALLPRLAELPAPAPLVASIPLWDSPAARDAARRVADATALPPELQFRLHIGVVAPGHSGEITGALAAARAPDETAWFRRADWEALLRRTERLACAVALADSPHHHAYQPAIAILLEQAEPSAEVAAALRRFLEVEGERPLELRRQVALRLAASCADLAGLPLLIAQLADVADAGLALVLSRMPAAVWPVAAPALTMASLVGGPGACSEKRLLTVLRHARTQRLVDTQPLSVLYASILDLASTAAARREASAYATEATKTADDRLRVVGQVFAWGVRRAFELTGRLLRVHMTGQEREFGHTRLDTSKLYVSPLPMLRGDPNGQDVVEGLILHEIGHHVYHGSDESRALWKQAHEEGIGPLLNLVADEHLERNLRGVDAAYGDRLKRLAAYAFQHAAQELRLEDLLACLLGSAAPALIAARIEVAFNEGAVRLRRGAVLAELDRIGHPLAR